MLLEPGPTPLYYQLEKILKERIQKREFGPGELLPTEEALCKAYGVSRATVRRAFDSLLSQHIISRRRGVGTFVAEANTRRSVRLVGSLEDLLTYPGRFSYRLLSKTETSPPPMVAKALELSSSATAMCMEVIGYLEHEPFAHSKFFFPDWVGSLIDRADTKEGLPIVRIAEQKINQRVVRAEQTVKPILADKFTAKYLGIKLKTPLLEVVRTYYTAAGRPVEVAVVRYHPARYNYTIELVTAPL